MISRAPKFLAIALVLLSGLTALWIQPSAQACTGIMLRNADGSIVHGRTLEFGVTIEVTQAIVPRGYEFVGKAPGGPGMKYKAKYGCVGSYAFKDLAICDGLNEKGLAVHAFYFPTFAKYAEITDENRGKALSPLDFSNWLLVQFATVSEVREALDRGDAVIAPTVLEAWGPEPLPLHYVVYDKTGGCIVIEPIEGKLKIFNNPLGVLTNSPALDWHMTNLRNYVALNPLDVPPVELNGVKLRETGIGSGMLGLPGDFTPPSRFVRAAVFSAAVIPSPNADQGILLVFHILNNFDIPLGIVREKGEKGAVYKDYTQLTTATDPQNLRYYYKTYEDQTIRMLDLRKFDLNAKEMRKHSPKTTQPVVDMSAEMK